MCGFIGLLNCKLDNRFQLDLLKHRGPDYSDQFTSELFSCGHTRLNIVDHNPSSNQPFISSDNRYVFVFNGEIYNFKDLYKYLSSVGIKFETFSDTEVLFQGLILEGVDFLSKCNGMFSFLLWDSKNKSLFCARDRFGKKPLYFTVTSRNEIIFASEMKALFPYIPRIKLSKRLPHYFRNPFDYEYSSNNVFSGVENIMPGHYSFINLNDLNVIQKRWWSTLDQLVSPPSTYNGQVDYFRELFIDAVRLRLQADVPVASALSGGLDSSAVFCVSDMLFKSGQVNEVLPLKGFVSKYDDDYLDESNWARYVAEHTSRELIEVAIDPSTCEFSLTDAFYYVEDPYITLPLPMLQTYRNIRDHGYVVTLDGHGADELMSGYGDLFLLHSDFDYHKSKDVIAAQRSLVSGSYSNVNNLDLVKGYSGFLYKFLGRYIRDRMWHNWSLHHPDIDSKDYKALTPFSRRLYQHFHFTILPTLLRNYDRYSMASGVEVRMPFMDHRIVSFLFSIPDSSKFGDGFTKRILRDSMRDIVPREILERRDKLGWNAPLHKWLVGPLRHQIDHALQHENQFQSEALRAWQPLQSKNSLTFHQAQAIWQSVQPAIWYNSVVNKAES